MDILGVIKNKNHRVNEFQTKWILTNCEIIVIDIKLINMKRIILIVIVSTLSFILMNSCSSTRKCDGRKGQKTPMGLI